MSQLEGVHPSGFHAALLSALTAFKNGDLSTRLERGWGESADRVADAFNEVVDQFRSFAEEATRVAHDVGTEGRLGGQMSPKSMSGTWKDLTDSLNIMVGNLTSQIRNIAEVTIAVAEGDLSKKVTVDVKGELLELRDTINTMVDHLRSFAAEVTRVAREIGMEGKLGGQAQVPGVSGTWKDLVETTNALSVNLTGQIRDIGRTIAALANGELPFEFTVEARGEVLELKNTFITIINRLRSFVSEVSRMLRQVGSDLKLEAQPELKELNWVWKDLTDSLKCMADNLTLQVREIAVVAAAVANGDLSKRVTVDVEGEALARIIHDG